MKETVLRKIPKVELHRHIEGSVRLETIKDLARYHEIDLGAETGDQLLAKTKITEPMKNLESVLDVFWTTQKVFCRYEAIKRITFENVEDAFHDGVKLLELRFAPVFMAHGKDLAFDEIYEGVLDGITKGMETYDIQVGLIHILPRPLEPEKHESSLEEFLRYRRSHHVNSNRLCGFDLADSETTTDTADFVPFIIQARRGGLGITVHTGENTDAHYVRKTITTYAPERIGHGIKCINNSDVLNLVKVNNIHLEICPTSNWLTRSVPSMEKHPLPDLYKEGISLSINSDDPHLMDIDLVEEYARVIKYFQLSEEDLYKINKDTLTHSFLEAEIREFVRKKHFA